MQSNSWKKLRRGCGTIESWVSVELADRKGLVWGFKFRDGPNRRTKKFGAHSAYSP